jgi:CheY-like chemotaxis protein
MGNAPRNDGDGHVLLVDDHDDTRELAAEILRMEGFVVRDVASAEDALVEVDRELPRAVITDLTLGGLSGDDLARQLRGGELTRAISLVAMTGHTSARDDEGSLWDRVLIKPVDPYELARAVRELLAAQTL